MVKKEARALMLSAVMIGILTTTSAVTINENRNLHKELTQNTAAYHNLQSDFTSLKTEQAKLNEKYNTLDEYVQTNKSALQNAEQLRKTNEQLKKENALVRALLQAKNKSANIPSRGEKFSVFKEGQYEVRKITVELSMYCREDFPGKTASGTQVDIGQVAAPSTIPFGTVMAIEGFDQVFTVTDRGGYINKVGDTYRIDIFVNTRKEAIKFGRKFHQTAYIIVPTEE